jgi:hypothetical protein
MMMNPSDMQEEEGEVKPGSDYDIDKDTDATSKRKLKRN